MLEELKKELKTPGTVIAVIITLGSIITSILISAYFYYKSEKQGIFLYKVEQVLAFNKIGLSHALDTNSNNSPLIVTDSDGNEINDNVFAANITIWNGGNDEIHFYDVREPFTIKLDGGGKLFNINIFEATNSNVDKFNITKNNVIVWDHFDQGDGFKVKLLYASQDMRSVVISGRAINSQGPFNGAVRSREGVLGAIGAFLGATASILAMLFALFLMIKDFRNERVETLKGLLFSVSAIVIIIGGFWGVRYLIRVVAEAFGFIYEPPL